MTPVEPLTAQGRANCDLALAVARLAEDAASTRTLVYGSLPPHGRDLDLMVRDEEFRALGQRLREAGLRSEGNTFAAFGYQSAFAIDVSPAAEWGLPAAEVSRLFTDARPLPGLRWLVRPSPSDALLVLARRGVGGRRAMNAKWKRAVDDALEDDPGAWTTAAQRAPHWGVAPELLDLERAWRIGHGSAARRLTVMPIHLATVPGRALRRLRGGAIVALSGLDGSGKSTQADALVHCLGRLGIDAVVVWKPVATNRLLQLGARLGRSFLGRGGRGKADRAPRQARPAVLSQEPHALASRPVLRREWAIAIAVVSSVNLSWAAAVHIARGRVVVFDRYQLDTAMLLHARHGALDLRAPERLIRGLTPAPLRAYLLDVPPAVAHARKPRKYDLDELTKRAAIYRRIYRRWQVTRLDAERTAEAVSAEIAGDVWSAVMRLRTPPLADRRRSVYPSGIADGVAAVAPISLAQALGDPGGRG